jgi:DNA-binding NarL/FixJ family response regulator
MKKWKTRVLLVNGNGHYSDQTETILDSDDYKIVGSYRDIFNASLSLPKSQPEIIVIWVPHNVDDSFFATLRKIRSSNLSMRFLIVMDNADSHVVFELISIGVIGILPSTILWQDIVRQLQRIEVGHAPITPKVAKIILDSLRLNLMSDLSRREIEILKLMFLGMTYFTISEKLTISKETTKTHMRNIYRKLNVNSKEEALAKAIDDRLIIVNL